MKAGIGFKYSQRDTNEVSKVTATIKKEERSSSKLSEIKYAAQSLIS